MRLTRLAGRHDLPLSRCCYFGEEAGLIDFRSTEFGKKLFLVCFGVRGLGGGTEERVWSGLFLLGNGGCWNASTCAYLESEENRCLEPSFG